MRCVASPDTDPVFGSAIATSSLGGGAMIVGPDDAENRAGGTIQNLGDTSKAHRENAGSDLVGSTFCSTTLSHAFLV